MRSLPSWSAALLTAALLGLAPAAAHAATTPTPVPTPAPSEAPSEAPVSSEDPCAPVDGQVPVMCQAGAPVPVQAPVQAPAAELPLTGRDDVPALAAGALLLLVAGTGLVHAGRARA